MNRFKFKRIKNTFNWKYTIYTLIFYDGLHCLHFILLNL